MVLIVLFGLIGLAILFFLLNGVYRLVFNLINKITAKEWDGTAEVIEKRFVPHSFGIPDRYMIMVRELSSSNVYEFDSSPTFYYSVELKEKIGISMKGGGINNEMISGYLYEL